MSKRPDIHDAIDKIEREISAQIESIVGTIEHFEFLQNTLKNLKQTRELYGLGRKK